MVDAQVIDDIITLINPLPHQTIVEIGPGPGALTHHLIRSGADLHGIEIDSDLVRKLHSLYSADSLTLHHADALRFDYASISCANGKLRVTGNLPYSISTPLLLQLSEYAPLIEDLCLMVQLEVAQRLTAECGTKHYGRLSVCISRLFQVESVFNVSPNAFSPPPEVHSSVIVMRPKAVPATDPAKELVFSALVRLAFGRRRKTLRNSLGGVVDEAIFDKAGIDAGLRAENLSVECYMDLAKYIVSNAPERGNILPHAHD